jgi:hypothetical protein
MCNKGYAPYKKSYTKGGWSVSIFHTERVYAIASHVNGIECRFRYSSSINAGKCLVVVVIFPSGRRICIEFECRIYGGRAIRLTSKSFYATCRMDLFLKPRYLEVLKILYDTPRSLLYISNLDEKIYSWQLHHDAELFAGYCGKLLRFIDDDSDYACNSCASDNDGCANDNDGCEGMHRYCRSFISDQHNYGLIDVPPLKEEGMAYVVTYPARSMLIFRDSPFIAETSPIVQMNMGWSDGMYDMETNIMRDSFDGLSIHYLKGYNAYLGVLKKEIRLRKAYELSSLQPAMACCLCKKQSKCKKIVKLSCGHMLHIRCVANWWQTSNNCPSGCLSPKPIL